MSIIYNKVYKVPAWVVVSGPKDTAKLVSKAFTVLGAAEIKWIADTFPMTVVSLATRGWSHEVNKQMPFFMNPDFLNVAASAHVKQYGLNKNLTGISANSMSNIDRKITSGDDYVRIFNDVLCNESTMALSHLFSIAEQCYGERENIKVFVTAGQIPQNILQRLAERVITIGGTGSDIQFPETVDEESLEVIVGEVAAILGYKA